MRRVGVRGMSLCFLVYAAIGITGFLAFGEETNGNIMINLNPYLKENDPMVITGFACMAFAVTMAYPLNIFPIRYSVETILFYHRPSLESRFMKIVIAVVAVGTSLVAAVYIPSINLVFELVGATTGSFVCFIGPGLLYLKLDHSEPGHLFQRSKWNSWILIIVGTLFFLLGTFSSIKDIVKVLAEPPANTTMTRATLQNPLLSDVANFIA
jgi:amino acid permease